MRTLSLIVLLAVCSCDSSDEPSSEPEICETGTCACPTSVATFCATHDCNLTLTAAERDHRLCERGFGPRKVACGPYQVIFESYIDTGMAHYYRDGHLVAEILTGMLSHCLAGPATFEGTGCSGDAQPLAVCGAAAL